ncbi:hypothetical protein ACOBQX_07915 [Actinokineospora sp. G85]|uniref:hypothetical protein n=1 Tax=Actinokineospora sp. G85 TaxID=3406626 RepID=UPI003C794A5D
MSPLVLPISLLHTAREFFEECGALGNEGTAMIKNGPDGPALVVPEQVPRRFPGGGVSVKVTRAGQMQLALALGDDDLYVARVHSHPGEAFHSRADDANPVLTHQGALSIVVPFFGLGLRKGLANCAVFRRENDSWKDLPAGPGRDCWILTAPETWPT